MRGTRKIPERIYRVPGSSFHNNWETDGYNYNDYPPFGIKLEALALHLYSYIVVMVFHAVNSRLYNVVCVHEVLAFLAFAVHELWKVCTYIRSILLYFFAIRSSHTQVAECSQRLQLLFLHRKQL